MAQQNVIKKIISNPLVHTLLIYISGGWIALEITDYIINNYGLNDMFRDVLSIILLAGLPLAIFLTWFLSREKKNESEKVTDEVNLKKTEHKLQISKKKLWFAIPAAVMLILLIGTGVRYLQRQVKIKWAIEKALPEMNYWIGERDQVKAFLLSQQIAKYIPDNPEFVKLDQLTALKFNVITDPGGVDVYYKEYSHVNDEWTLLGTTPIINVSLPNWVLYRWKLEKPGYEDVYAVAPTHMDTLYRTMHQEGIIPEGMVYVEGIYPQTASDFLSREKNGFYIDKYEVTNQAYKEFMDQGGYRDPAFWKNAFVMNKDTLSFDEAMKYFVDHTGRPGPATWEAGDYPDGQDDYPVNGISWYEAAAYADFADKSLPTTLHWQSAAGYLFDEYPQLYGSNVVPLSNMGGSGPEPAGSNEGTGYFGTYDMAGNVREWCWNKSLIGRAILGGAWNDVSYLSTDISQMPAFDRSPKNGFRCVVYPDSIRIPEQVFQALAPGMENRDYNIEEPASETAFQYYRQQFLYDKDELNSQIEERTENLEDWYIDKISFNAAYEDERMIAYLFLPKEFVPPYQTIIFFPGAYALEETRLLESVNTYWRIDYLLKNGRAVMFPIYKGTYDRLGGSCNGPIPGDSYQYAECLVKRVKDLSRSIDYLETREDIDTSRLGYIGESWGGWMGNINLAVEDRLKLSVLIIGGLPMGKMLPEVDPINYVSRINIPVLMLNGRYDLIFPYESSVKPMLDLLGTPDKDKKLLLYETDHFVTKSEIIKETLNWLDTYFGPVQK